MLDEEKDLALSFWMAGVSLAHALRFVAFDDPINRQVIAAGGVLIYALAAALAVLGKTWSLTVAQGIAAIFPLVGISLVLVTGADVDQWQFTVGITQLSALAYVLFLWVHELSFR